MLLIFKFCLIQVLLVRFKYVSGMCPHAYKYFSNQVEDALPKGDGVESLDKNYLSAISYDTYETVCHRFNKQPPPISESVIKHAFQVAVVKTKVYETLDDLLTTTECRENANSGRSLARTILPGKQPEKPAKPAKPGNPGKPGKPGKPGQGSTTEDSEMCPPNFLQNMDRNNFLFESATKYVQETTCSSKRTTIFHLPNLTLEQVQDVLLANVTRVTCERGVIRSPNCTGISLVRQFDGTCNNLERPFAGSVGDSMRRILQADYKDGVSQLRTSIDGSPLPNPRIISTSLFGNDANRPLSSLFTQFHSFFGEFVISDNGMTLSHDTGMRIKLPCCDTADLPKIEHPQCAAFAIPPTDVLCQTNPNNTCMQFTRSIPSARCNLGPRKISNTVTATQDLNSVYGVSISMSTARRTMGGGLLLSEQVNGEEIFAIERFNSSGQWRCFMDRCVPSPLDTRNLLTPMGLIVALLFHRNHNKHAFNIAKIKTDWTDEQIFQEARKWNIAEYQHAVYGQYLETLIGEELVDVFGILPKPLGEFSDYEPDALPKATLEFQTTAGRHGHTTLPEDVSVIDSTGRETKISFRDSQRLENLFHDGLMDGIITAQMVKQAFATTPSIPFKTFLPNRPVLDLAASDIQRQRDHAVPGYIHYVKHCHNIEFNCWEDLEKFIDAKDIEKLKKHYKFVEDVELYVGGHYERKIPGVEIGPTFASIIGAQFHDAKYGDRFYYEHCDQAGSFTVEQLNEIKSKSCLARVLCKNTHLDYVLSDPFKLISQSNRLVSCDDFADFDYHL